ncbi:hypothetical protein DUI87_07607 [Hirundo rustica rustica]|uniref:Uncharacterized protein n=1 Tax=Hirundo rustica rustica TaxID=333673 RepID=A0A3M0KQQ3_HIRRU|nr:hypothetical protein DUI87_07607 [Hirundo rustica rustica]
MVQVRASALIPRLCFLHYHIVYKIMSFQDKIFYYRFSSGATMKSTSLTAPGLVEDKSAEQDILGSSETGFVPSFENFEIQVGMGSPREAVDALPLEVLKARLDGGSVQPDVVEGIVLQIPLVLETAKVSPNHRVAKDRMDLCRTLGPTVQGRPHRTDFPGLSRWLLNICKDGDPKPSLDSLCPCLVTLTQRVFPDVQKVFLISFVLQFAPVATCLVTGHH